MSQQPLTNETANEIVTLVEYKDFDDMGLKFELLRGIYGYGFQKPSMIQQKAIKIVSGERDLIAQAQSGSGKTGAMCIGILNKLELNGDVQFLVLAPTRELAKQITLIVRILGEYLNVKAECFVGGNSISFDIQALKGRPHIVVGTPGRLLDLIEKGYLKLNHCKTLIIDEADKMLEIGFKETLHEVFRHLPETVQACLFSATFEDEVLELTKKFMRDPVQILLNKEKVALEAIRQFYVEVDTEEQKFETLIDLYKSVTMGQTVIFCKSKGGVERLNQQLCKSGFTVSAIHGEMEQSEREKLINAFYNGDSRLIIATDLLARGIDAHHVSVVINFDLPLDTATYVHRIGRAARFGRKGVTLNLVTKRDFKFMSEVESQYKCQIEQLPEDFQSYL